jgi:hypothetical protein
MHRRAHSASYKHPATAAGTRHVAGRLRGVAQNLCRSGQVRRCGPETHHGRETGQAVVRQPYYGSDQPLRLTSVESRALELSPVVLLRYPTPFL